MLLHLHISFVLGEVLAYGEYAITYVAFDAANNTANCSFHVAVTRKNCLNHLWFYCRLAAVNFSVTLVNINGISLYSEYIN